MTADRLVRHHRHLLDRLLRPRGLRLRRRRAAPVVGRPISSAGSRSTPSAPFWDGNEVWLVVARRGDVRRVPRLVRHLVLGALPRARAAAGRADRPRRLVRVPRQDRRDRWRGTWSWTLTIGSIVAPLLFGIALGDLLAGLPIDADGEFTGSVLDLLTAVRRLVGLTLLALCLLHGSTFLALRTTGVLRSARATMARRAGRRRARHGRRVRGLDPRAGQPGQSADRRCWPSRCSRSSRGRCVVPRTARRLGVRRDRGRDRPRPSRSMFVEPLPERDGLEHRRGEQPHRRGHRVGRLRAQGDDDRRCGDGPARAAVPGLDLRRVPRPGRAAVLDVRSNGSRNRARPCPPSDRPPKRWSIATRTEFRLGAGSVPVS